MERSGLLLERANLAFQAVNGANTNDTLQATDTKTSPLFAAHTDFIYLNAKLFQRFKTLHDHQAELSLNPEQAKLLDVYYKQFVHAGAELPPAKQAQLKAMNTRLSTLQTDFTPKAARGRQGRRAARRPTRRRSPACRTSRSPPPQEAAKDRKLAGYVLPLQNTTQQPSLEFADQPRHAPGAVRREPQPRRAWRRQRHARDRSARSPSCARRRRRCSAIRTGPTTRCTTRWRRTARPRSASSTGWRRRLRPSSGRKAADIRALAKSQGANFEPTAADWNFYAEQIRKQRYALDSDQLKPYFEFNKVLRTASSTPPTSSTG